VRFVNEHSGSQRKLGGGFEESAGRVAVLDEVARKFAAASSNGARKSLIAEAEKLAEEHRDEE